MRPRIALLVIAAVALLNPDNPLNPVAVPPAVADPPIPAPIGPPLRETPEALAGTLTCPDRFDPAHDPVLLVHATTETAERNWSSNYGRVLPALGFDVCTVELVDEATGDIQASAERTVYAIRAIAGRTGKQVKVVGHSQGPLEVRWAVKYWPDIRLLVDDLIGIAAPYHGWRQTDLYCSSACVAALWQMRMESMFMGALNAGDETPGDVSYTSVYTLNDELVQPYMTAELDGGTNVPVQAACPGRVVEHIEMVFDAAVYGLVLDALRHPGPADPGRFDPALCLQRTMPGVSPADLIAGEVDFWTHAPGKLGENQLTSEPPLEAYAR